MLNRFKSAVNTVVTGISQLDRPGPEAIGFQEYYGEEATAGPLKFPYSRPEFLQLNSDEVLVSADHVSRPILVPRDISRIPWAAGYAEVINAGKSRFNEDQAHADTFFVPRSPNIRGSSPGKAVPNGAAHPVSDSPSTVTPPTTPPTTPLSDAAERQSFEEVANDPLPFTYFALFDGHAGSGCAVVAVHILHSIIQEKLCQIRELLLRRRYGYPIGEINPAKQRQYLTDKSEEIDEDDLVTGALEAAFFKMDKLIYEEKQNYDITGGCTAVVALFFLGKLYVANAGDSRAVIARGDDVIPMSKDFTPESERERLRLLGFLCPELLQNEFTHLEFSRRVNRSDIGRKVLCRNARMKGWTLKTITADDVRYPLIAGEGKKARLLATIGVTRGFGDHDLTVGNSTIHIKPFLTPAPEVNIYELQGRGLTEDDVLIMGTDGLWDVTSNKRAAEIVKTSLKQFDTSEKARYTSAGQDLVMNARGLLKKGWRTVDDNMASGDDITVFVVPLHHYSSAPSEPTAESSQQA